jgi:hypothetical protein
MKQAALARLKCDPLQVLEGERQSLHAMLVAIDTAPTAQYAADVAALFPEDDPDKICNLAVS